MQQSNTGTATQKKAAFLALLLVCVLPNLVTPPLALAMGFAFAHFLGHPFRHLNHKATNWLLKASVVGLGFGMNLQSTMETGKEGFWLTIASVTITLTLGILGARLLRLTPKLSHLIASGTAICGGSAIAALAPVLQVNEKEMSVSLGTVFLLNAVALLVFPFIGHALDLTQHQFGVWSAIAIHDTSSVVGAASAFGEEALRVATTVKLARALWIVPVAFLSSLAFGTSGRNIRFPWFIGLFAGAMLLNSFFPAAGLLNHHIVSLSKAGLTVTLFLVGAGLSAESVKAVGWRPLVLGISLWVTISVLSLGVILYV
ncbi:YeiH family protein [Botryobacter ruber]|uniref:YeiH family protein n=1 Tax=Botryobacter ruber TaxID=2171629 RepID=UPI000E0A4086|nr:putative sulfate exporter family transporter [Botryobacter ruber]